MTLANAIPQQQTREQLSCFDIADYFLNFAQETGSYISNLKLQKLVYYAQAWHLALYGEPLFAEDFQAWIHGPVIPALYQKYKSFGWQPILTKTEPVLPQSKVDFLGEVISEYFACDAYELEQMTHAEEPWSKARGPLAQDAVSEAVIEKDWIKDYYASRAEETN